MTFPMFWKVLVRTSFSSAAEFEVFFYVVFCAAVRKRLPHQLCVDVIVFNKFDA